MLQPNRCWALVPHLDISVFFNISSNKHTHTVRFKRIKLSNNTPNTHIQSTTVRKKIRTIYNFLIQHKHASGVLQLLFWPFSRYKACIQVVCYRLVAACFWTIFQIQQLYNYNWKHEKCNTWEFIANKLKVQYMTR